MLGIFTINASTTNSNPFYFYITLFTLKAALLFVLNETLKGKMQRWRKNNKVKFIPAGSVAAL